MVTYLSVRGILATSLVLASLSIYFIFLNSKEKSEYDSIQGKVISYSLDYGTYPKRHRGDMRYLDVNNYDYPFEIYVPSNVSENANLLEKLKIGDHVTVYYYENHYTYRDGVNKFAQYIDSGITEIYRRNDLQRQIGAFLILSILLLNVMSYFLYKKRKIPW